MRFDDLIDETIAKQRDDFVPAVLAEQLVARVKREDAGAFRAWINARAVVLVTHEIQQRVKMERREAMAQAVRGAFADAARTGDTDRLSLFMVRYAVDAENTRRTVADMTGADHRYVATLYQRDGNMSLMLAAFHQAVAKRIDGHRTAEVLTEEQYERLLRSIVKP